MKILCAITTALLLTAAGFATGVVSERTVWETTAEGAFPYTETGSSEPVLYAPPASDAPPEQLWTHNELINIYLTTAFGDSGQHIFAGTKNGVCRAQMFSLTGNGAYTWQVEGASGEEVYTAGARDADAFAATFTGTPGDVRFFTSASSTPVWTYTPPSGEVADGPLAFPADGSFVVTTFNDGSNTKLRVLNATNGAVIDEATTTNPYQRAKIIVSPDGKYIMYRNSSVLHVYAFNGTTLTLRESVNVGASTDCHGLSPDGKYLAYGFSSMSVREWNGSAYAPLFTHVVSGSYARNATFDAEGRLYTSWYRSDYKKPSIVCHTLPSSTPTWTFDYQVVAGSNQELIVDLAVTEDGDYLAAASWGNESNLNPELEIFNARTGDYLFGVDSPGSMGACDIVVAGSNAYATAGGKNVHFNTMGRGGDIYCVHVANDVPVTGPDNFVARAAGDSVRVSWSGRWEGLAGFNLYREAPADAGRVKLNGELITGRPPFRFEDDQVEEAGAYEYWLEVVDTTGARETYGPAVANLPVERPAFALYQNTPNPTAGATTFTFSLAENGPATLAVYDLAGRRVWRHEGTFTAGANEIAATLPFAPGVYVYRLEAGGESSARKFVINN
ncbi:MAG: T9SS type A sorting domain-containing protein [Candidatus Zixiibacteriota bacterium]|jgi:hypothetical protein